MLKRKIFQIVAIGALTLLGGAGCVNSNYQNIPVGSNTPFQTEPTSSDVVQNTYDNLSFTLPSGWTQKKSITTDYITYTLTYQKNPAIYLTVNSPIPGLDFFGEQIVESKSFPTNDKKVSLKYELYRPCLDTNEEMSCVGSKTAQSGGVMYVTWGMGAVNTSTSTHQGMIIAQLQDENARILNAAEEAEVKKAILEIINTFKFTDIK